MLTKSERGKRTLGRQLLVFEGALAILGLHIPEALDLAKFFAPYIIPAATGLFIGDAYFHNKSYPSASPLVLSNTDREGSP